MKDSSKSISTNTFYNLISSILNLVFRFITSIFLARMLGPEKMGTYSLVIFTLGVLDMIANCGINNVATKYISQFSEKEKRGERAGILLYAAKRKLVLSLAASVLMFFMSGYYSSFYSLPRLKLYAVILSFILIPYSFSLFMESVVKGLQRFKAIAYCSFFLAPLQLIATITVLELNGSIPSILLVIFAISTAQIFIYYQVIKDKIELKRFKTKLSDNIKKRVFIYNWQVAVILFIDTVVWQKSEVFFLGKMSNQSDIAFYTIAYNLSSLLVTFLPAVYTGVLFPALSEIYGRDDTKAIRRIYISASRYIMMVSIPLCIMAIALSKHIVQLFYGVNYLAASAPFRILLISACIGVVASAGSAVIYATEKQGMILKVGSMIALVNLSLDFAMIPRYGAVGAAIANSAAQSIAVLIGTLWLCRVISVKFPVNDMVKITVSSSFLFLGYWATNALVAFLIIIVALLIYLTLLLRMGVIRQSDVYILRGAHKNLPIWIGKGFERIVIFLEKHAVADSL